MPSCSPTPISREFDPELDSLVNVNAPDDYAEARQRPCPEVVVECFGALALGGRRGPRSGPRSDARRRRRRGRDRVLDRYVMAALNGDQITHDAQLPLVAGDTIAFLSADAGG